MLKAGFDHSYAALGAPYASPQALAPVAKPRLLCWNEALAAELGWHGDPRTDHDLLAALAGNQPLTGSRPIATVYAGHQFGSYNPQLGDGRATLLGEWLTPAGQRFDIQLKGAGPTPYSRGGDGRSPIGPVVREYLVSEAMHALGVPTSRSLAAVATGEGVVRNRIEPGAILTRVASSHLRIGTIQFFAMTQAGEGLESLVNYVCRRHFGDALEAGGQDAAPAHILLQQVSDRLAKLVVHWQALGFVHGVLNTDNALLCGETIDFGPCAFIDHFDPNACFSSIDHNGRYAWPNQPAIMHWNIAVLAECLLGLIDTDPETARQTAQGVVDGFAETFRRAHLEKLARKFGLDAVKEEDLQLIQGFHDLLAEHQLDLTLSFRWLTESARHSIDNTPIADLYMAPAPLKAWSRDWALRRRANRTDNEATEAAMLTTNPVVIPRNHLVQRAIEQAEAGDASFMAQANLRWRTPFDWQDGDQEWARPPEPHERVTRTFCGT